VKTPGFFSIKKLKETDININYQQRFDQLSPLPEAYTRLILNVLRGEHVLFVRADEIIEAWRVVDKVVEAVEKGRLKVLPYVRGTCGPRLAIEVAKKYWKQRTFCKRSLQEDNKEAKQTKIKTSVLV